MSQLTHIIEDAVATGNTTAPSIIIGERAAELLQTQHNRLGPETYLDLAIA